MADQRAECVHERGGWCTERGERRCTQKNDPGKSEESKGEARRAHASFYGELCVAPLRADRYPVRVRALASGRSATRTTTRRNAPSRRGFFDE
jgi:hypothetical protein